MNNYFLGIGVDSYSDDRFSRLSNASRDVEKIAEVLNEYYLFDPFRITLLLKEKATAKSILNQIAYFQQLSDKFNLVIYFAGHGVLYPNPEGEEGYIIPYDAYFDDSNTWINQKSFLGGLEEIDNCHHLLLLWDSCFSGSLFDVSSRQGPGKDNYNNYPSRWAITSGSKWEEVYDGFNLIHSPFADALKRTLHIQMDMIPASHLAKELQSFMVRNNHNPPLLAPLLMKGHEWGEFAFEMNSRYVEQTISTTILIPPVADPIVFFGRVEELHEIRQRLTRLSKGGHILLLHAEGGMGKTSLASKYWHNYQRAYKNMAWLNCQNGIYSDALPRLAMALGIEMDLGTDYLPLLKKRLLAINDRFLLVMDNVDDATEISSFQLEFGKLNLQILVTSRCQNVLVEKTQEMLLGSLPKHLARKLFREYYSKESGAGFENLLDRFLDAIGSHTLLIEVFAKNLNEASTLSPTPLTMETFLAKLEESGLYLESDSFTMRTHYTGNVEKSAANTNDILNILYDFSKLSEDERHMLVNLALLPAEHYQIDFLMELFDSNNDEKYETTIDLLNRKGWIGGTQNNYRISPVIQNLVVKKNENNLNTDSVNLLKNLEKKLRNNGSDFNYGNLVQIAPYSNLTTTIAKSLKNFPSANLATICFNTAIYFENVGNFKQTSFYFMLAADLFFKINLVSSYLNSLLRNNQIQLKSGDVILAKKSIEDIQKKYIEFIKSEEFNIKYNDVQKKYTLIEYGSTYSKLADYYYNNNELEKANKYCGEFHQIIKSIDSKNDPIIEFRKSQSLRELAKVNLKLKRYELALDFYLESHSISQNLTNKHPSNLTYLNGLAIALEGIGKVYQSVNKNSDALVYMIESVNAAEMLLQLDGTNLFYKNGLLHSYRSIGFVYEIEEKLDLAIEYYNKAISINETICEECPENQTYKISLITLCENIAYISHTKKDYQFSLINYHKCIKLYEQLHSEYKKLSSSQIGIASTFFHIGEVHADLNEFSLAVEYTESGINTLIDGYESINDTTEFDFYITLMGLNACCLHIRLDNISNALDYLKISHAHLNILVNNNIKIENYEAILDLIKISIEHSSRIKQEILDHISIRSCDLIDLTKDLRRLGKNNLVHIINDRFHNEYNQINRLLSDENWYNF